MVEIESSIKGYALVIDGELKIQGFRKDDGRRGQCLWENIVPNICLSINYSNRENQKSHKCHIGNLIINDIGNGRILVILDGS